jgi:hypothetical protein
MKQKFVVNVALTYEHPNKITKKDVKHLVKLNLDSEYCKKVTVRTVDFD